MTPEIGLGKFAIVIILICGFIIGTGLIGMDQLTSTSITYNHPGRILCTYLLSTLIMGIIYLCDKSDKK